jgi:hypothetical protein
MCCVLRVAFKQITLRMPKEKAVHAISAQKLIKDKVRRPLTRSHFASSWFDEPAFWILGGSLPSHADWRCYF